MVMRYSNSENEAKVAVFSATFVYYDDLVAVDCEH